MKIINWQVAPSTKSITTLDDKNYPLKNENTHWDSENALWHYRKTKRATVEDGRSVYFLEEVQSDCTKLEEMKDT